MSDEFEIKIRSDRRIKKFSINVSLDKGVWANVPMYMSNEEAMRILNDSREKIKDSYNRLKQKAAKRNKILSSVFTPSSIYKTRFLSFVFRYNPDKFRTIGREGDTAIIYYDTEERFKEESFQKAVKTAIVKYLKIEAKQYLIPKTIELAKKHDFRIREVKVTNATTRWGSCSYNNNINLSLHLIRLPDRLLEMVILHELCHTIVKNHSSAFRNLLKEYCPDLDELEQELKRYSPLVL
ncbi:MAG: M48 family metallopeptidase [Marinifilaceae bacterium]|nr:M48 family metallopeptidase [Marinifilaceae bacterium]